MLFLPARHKCIDLNVPLTKNRLVHRWHDLTVFLPSNSGSSLDNSVVRWCCISDAELRKCEEWALSIKSDPLVCVQANSMTKCIEMIKVGDSLWSEYMIRLHRVCTSLSELTERKRKFMRGNFQPVGKYSCLVTQFMQILFLLFSIMLLAE